MKLFKSPAALLNPVVLASTAASMGGDLMSYEAERRANQEANATVRENNIWELQLARENAELQKEFAKNGIRWKVEDAVAAGLHPLAAVGASGASFSPSAVAFNSGSPDYSKANMFRSMGQNFSRAIEATMDLEQREYNRKRNELELERAGMENELLKINLMDAQRAKNPPFPSNSGIGGDLSDVGIRGSLGPIESLPLGRTKSPSGRPDKAYGSVTGWTYEQLPGRRLRVIPSPDVQGSLANNMVEMLNWEMTHKVGKWAQPNLYRPNADEYPLQEGKRWGYSMLDGTFLQVPLTEREISKYGLKAGKYMPVKRVWR